MPKPFGEKFGEFFPGLHMKMGENVNKEKVLTKVKDLKKLGKEVFQQQEQSVRQGLERAFDKGLELAGKTLKEAMKAKEAFVAETKRKASSVKDPADTVAGFKEFISPSEYSVEDAYELPKEKLKIRNTKSTSTASRKRQHSAGISRSH